MMIKPIFAGHFYEADAGKLKKQVENCFVAPLGPKSLPGPRKEKRLFGVVAPHAGYLYSGPAAAWVYKEIAESKFAGTYVIIAPDHNGLCPKITTSKDNWETPFGTIGADREFIDKLLQKCGFVKTGEIKEHAIEVQLPFLQFACRDKIQELRIVPLVVPADSDLEALGRAISEINENCCVIASSDFTHYGPSYNFTPFRMGARLGVKRLDKKALELIGKLDAKTFLEYVEGSKATICGAYAIAATMEAVKEMFGKQGKVLAYYNSGDITKDYGNFVSYAAIEFI